MTTPELVGRRGAEGANVPVGTMPPELPPAINAHWPAVRQ